MSMNRSRRIRLRRQRRLEHEARSSVAPSAEPPLPETVLAMLQGALVAQRRAVTARSRPDRPHEEDQRQLLEDIELALDRLRRGTYGRCLRCAQPMAIDELEAAAYAKACRRCLMA